MSSPVRLLLLAATALALGGCQQEQRAKDERTAVGEILPGSVSDAMLPYDTVRSHPPLAPIAKGAGPAAERTAAATSSDQESEEAGSAEDASAETAAAATTTAAPESE